ncbi:MAG: Plug domain-containing protein [Treponema sp.]|jgi:hypothetical protein|nr:Plug domain-containing protein [Treponema sp.]
MQGKTAGLLCAFLLGLLLMPVSGLFAREVEITVQDADIGVPLEGALVRSWDGGQYTSDTAGRITLPVPDDLAVQVDVAYPGYESFRLSITPGRNRFAVDLRLRGVMENRELVIEGEREGNKETAPGKWIAGEELSRTAESGLVEDVMTSVGLLPGVGYAGFFDAMPSIRGGEPGDLTAVVDGYYIEDPYHWGGAYSIFDPRMTESARLSHGVFSARYGSTISALLEITPKKSGSITELDLGVSTNAIDLNVSFPFFGKGGSTPQGGVSIMGKATWWQPFIELAHFFMPISRNVKQAPWIASGAVNANYRISSNLEWTLSGFYGADGIGFSYSNDIDEIADDGASARGVSALSHFFDHNVGFLTTGLTINPLNDMVVKVRAGGGVSGTNVNIDMEDDLSIRYSDSFLSDHSGELGGKTGYEIEQDETHRRKDTTVHAQAGADMDWDLGGGFLIAVGAHERWSFWSFDQTDEAPRIWFDGTDFLLEYETVTADVYNNAFFTGAYTVTEYVSPNRAIAAELGLRLDHLALIGEDFSVQARPDLNPRLNVDFGLLKNKGILDSLTLTIGTGMFSSTDKTLRYLEKQYARADGFEMKNSRSWTSLAALSMEFSPGYFFSVEGYYKLVYDRTYINIENTAAAIPVYLSDGKGRIWGIDVLLLKKENRYWDGRISYSFNSALYQDPAGSGDTGNDWYYPSFHRFHTVHLALNIKPAPAFHIAIRYGFTSGKPEALLGGITAIPVERDDGTGNPEIIYQYRRTERYPNADNTERTAFSMPLDLKFSWYLFDRRGRVRTEIYFGVDNILALMLPSTKTTMANRYTGAEEETGGMAVMTQLAMPMPSFGVKWSY